MATDYLNQPLEVGATVVFDRPTYRDLTIGIVIKLTPQKARVLYRRHYGEYIDVHLVDQTNVVVVTNNAVAERKAQWIRTKAIEQGLIDPPSQP